MASTAEGQEYPFALAGLAEADQIAAYRILLLYNPMMTREDCEYVYQTIQDFIYAKHEATLNR